MSIKNTENLLFTENSLTADEVLAFQKKMNWSIDPKDQWEISLSHTVYSVTAVYNGEVVAMGRLLGDSVMYWYVNDVFVLTEYQGQGIGKEIMNRLIQYVRGNSLKGTGVSVCLMSAKGKEGFYEKLGFHRRPDMNEGAGMEMELYIE